MLDQYLELIAEANTYATITMTLNKYMISFACESLNTKHYESWHTFVVEKLMKSESWPSEFDVWESKDKTWGWLGTTHSFIFHSTITRLDMVMNANGFECPIEGENVRVYRPIDPFKILSTKINENSNHVPVRIPRQALDRRRGSGARARTCTTNLETNMAWHTDKTRLSHKSSASDLFKIMSIDPIRDEVMYWLSPMDAVQFVVGTGVLFSEEDMAKYTSIFKYVVPNRGWLMNMVKNGYTFTIVGRRLNEMTDRGAMEAWDPDTTKYVHTIKDKVVSLILFVTRDESFIACDSTFMPTHLFQIASNDKVTEEYKNNTTPEARIMVIVRHGVSITIKCPMTSWTTDVPLYLNSDTYENALADTHDGPHLQVYATKYAHMTKNRVMIKGPIRDVVDAEYTFTDAALNLFSIQTRTSGYHQDESVLFRINRHEFGPRHPARILGIIS